jgi:hypothetical protein
MWAKMLCQWETVFDILKDVLAFIFREKKKKKATQFSEMRITEEDTSVVRNVRNCSPNNREKLRL